MFWLAFRSDWEIDRKVLLVSVTSTLLGVLMRVWILGLLVVWVKLLKLMKLRLELGLDKLKVWFS